MVNMMEDGWRGSVGLRGGQSALEESVGLYGSDGLSGVSSQSFTLMASVICGRIVLSIGSVEKINHAISVYKEGDVRQVKFVVTEDAEAGVWIMHSPDVDGLIIEAGSIEECLADAADLLPELRDQIAYLHAKRDTLLEEILNDPACTEHEADALVYSMYAAIKRSDGRGKP